MKQVLPALLVSSFVLLGACARDASVYPSLAVRPTEKVGFAEPAPPPPEPLKVDVALDAKIADLTARLAAVTSGFDRDAARAETAARAAKGRAVGSDAWLDAQTALGSLDDWRAQASGLASEAGDLATARAAALEPPYPTLDSIQHRIAAEGNRHTATIDRLQAALPAA
ncbi:hypothetical protein [Sphingomonas sp. Leaf343]|uniref:hypothetical protein n=1 Tax=Sphingomonas sp. Leaf343 TaxID=1736345 RepID=UPI0006F5E896|nr:hypothetical protein [Sphingomonas sp. Leaf343]KQR81236.1 hypothetical protein ASG07_12300 [Sphingomonas sp. Leaf343]